MVMNVLEFQKMKDERRKISMVTCIRLFGGKAGTALMQRLISVREQFHSNMMSSASLTQMNCVVISSPLVSGGPSTT